VGDATGAGNGTALTIGIPGAGAPGDGGRQSDLISFGHLSGQCRLQSVSERIRQLTRRFR
jgi:hypothetical protein